MPDLLTDDGRTVPDSTAKFVLLALADHASDEGEGAYPGVKRICKKTSMSSQTVCNALNALRHNGYTTYVGKSKSDTNNYTINIEKLSQPLEFQRLESGDSKGKNPKIPAARVKPSVKPSNNHKKIIINNITAQLFIDTFGQFNSQKEQERWGVLYDSIGPDRAKEIIAWAEKKEIHLANRPSLIDSLETAAKKWKTTEQRKQTAAQSGDHKKYLEGDYADYIQH
jgi:hypothetical protein